MNKSKAESAAVIDTHDKKLFKVEDLENKKLLRSSRLIQSNCKT